MYTLVVVAVVLAVADWFAAERRWKRIEYVTKPAVMLLLLAWLWQVTGLRGLAAWFAVGAALSLAGDILLMLPRDLFIAGLTAFLLAHVAYIGGFNPTAPPINAVSILVAVALAVIVGLIYARLARGLAARNAGGLAAPLLVYAIVIAAMALSAVLTFLRPDWARPHALIVTCGAVLFMVSDSLLAWNRFIAPVRHGRFTIMATYHLAQFGILLGAVLHLHG